VVGAPASIAPCDGAGARLNLPRYALQQQKEVWQQLQIGAVDRTVEFTLPDTLGGRSFGNLQTQWGASTCSIRGERSGVYRISRAGSTTLKGLLIRRDESPALLDMHVLFSIPLWKTPLKGQFTEFLNFIARDQI
jgi:hypothetical protein